MSAKKPAGRSKLQPRHHPPHMPHVPRSFVQRLRRFFIGRPLATEAELSHRLPIYLALPLFASDALSSIAYATQEILIVLASAAAAVAAARAGTGYLMPISVAIAVLMLIVAYSYRRAIFLYPTGGGSYAVARKNLGSLAGLVTGTSLIVDYCLTVAVSASAGMAALTSIPALQHLQEQKALFAIGLVIIMAWINLRGIRESGLVFMLPAIAFVTMIGALVVSSIYHYLAGTVVPHVPEGGALEPTTTFTTLTLIWAFSSGCSALTGVEAVSNGVNTFQPPEAKNAAKTLLILIGVLVVLFLGVGFAAHVYQVIPSHHETLIAQLAEANFGHGFFYYMVIAATLGILMVASNTAFAGMPQLLATMARDGYAPRVLLGLGDRLVYARSIVGLCLVSCLLIFLFNANVTYLIPLYAVGVFLCFTMSQAGMFMRAIREKERGWVVSMLINGIGMTVTGGVMLILAITRFADGAWVVVILIPLLVWIGYQIKKHYRWFEQRMSIHPGEPNPLSGPVDHLTVVVLLSSDIHRGTLEGLEAARAIVEGRKSSSLRALHVQIDPEKTKRLTGKWEKMVMPYIGHMIQLDIVPSPYRQLIPPVEDYLDRLDAERNDDRVVVLIPEFETGGFWTHLLHNQTAPRLRKALFNRPNVTVITNRFFMHEDGGQFRAPGRKKKKRKSHTSHSHDGHTD
jgi:amino acid transporter